MDARSDKAPPERTAISKDRIFEDTQDISNAFVGVWLGGEIRAGWSRYGWQAWLLKYGPRGGVKSFKLLRVTKGARKGQPVKTMFHWEGIGHLITRVEELYLKGQLK